MEFINKHYRIILCCIPIISIALHFHVLNKDLTGIHVWRQTETQSVINNFYRESFNIFDPHVNGPADTDRIHRMEFPLMQWLFALFYKLFGSHISVTRVLTFIIGLFSVWGIFYLADKIFNNKVIATVCAWCFNFSPVFYYYTINPLPDNMAMCMGIWTIGLFYHFINTQKTLHLVLSGICLCIAALVKLPFILYDSFIICYLLLRLKRNGFHKSLFHIAGIYTLAIIPVITWYAWVIPAWNNGVVKGAFETKQSAQELLHILTATLTSILPELLINYGSMLFFVAGFYFLFQQRKQHKRNSPMFFFWGLSIIFYYLYEMNMITTVHDYYLFPFLPLIFLIVGYGCYNLLCSNNRPLSILSLVCLAILPLTAFLRIDSRWDTKDPGFNSAYYNNKEQLRKMIPADAYCVVGNDPSSYILLYYIDRKGWAFDDDELTADRLTYYISKGAQYLFSDSKADANPEIQAHLAEKIFEQGSLRVYKLK